MNTPKTPSILALSRQNLPILRKSFKKNMSIRGGYFIKKNKNAKLTIIATGSEVSIALDIQKMLKNYNIYSNLVSMPCIELFEMQNKNYKNNILGNHPKVIIEASSTQGWHKFLDNNDIIFGIDEFGESGKAEQLFNHFGITKEKILKKILKKDFR